MIVLLILLLQLVLVLLAGAVRVALLTMRRNFLQC
jgi:hypothetical protein